METALLSAALVPPFGVIFGLPAWGHRQQLRAWWQRTVAGLPAALAHLAPVIAVLLPAPRPAAPPTVLYAGSHRSPLRAQHRGVARLVAAVHRGAARFRHFRDTTWARS